MNLLTLFLAVGIFGPLVLTMALITYSGISYARAKIKKGPR